MASSSAELRCQVLIGREIMLRRWVVMLLLVASGYAGADALVFGTNGPKIYGYQASTGTLNSAFAGGGASLAAGADGLLYTNSWGSIQAYNPTTGTVVRTIDTLFSSESEIAYGQGLLFGTNGSLTYAYDAVTGTLVRSFMGGGNSLAYGSDGLLYASIGGSVQVFDPGTGSLVRSIAVNFSNDSDIAVGFGRVFGTNGGTIYAYDTKTGDLAKSFAGGGSGLAVDPHGLLYVTTWGTVTGFDPITGATKTTFDTNFSTLTDIAVFNVPEPSGLALTLVGVFALAVGRRATKISKL